MQTSGNDFWISSVTGANVFSEHSAVQQQREKVNTGEVGGMFH
jgi:hypothetical protein